MIAINNSYEKFDTDDDLLDDGEEILGLADHYQTNPLDADTDDDGIMDGNEGGIRVAWEEDSPEPFFPAPVPAC